MKNLERDTEALYFARKGLHTDKKGRDYDIDNFRKSSKTRLKEVVKECNSELQNGQQQ